MASSLPTNVNPGAASKQALERLELAFNRQNAMAATQLVDVVFPSTANTDLAIGHQLKTDNPESIRWIPVSLEFTATPLDAPVIYKDASVNRRTWASSTIFLRCTVAGVRARLLLFTEVVR